jgi:hypothetical protein
MELCWEKGATITAKYCVALLDKLKQHLILKYESKLSKGILFPQDIAASYKAANAHQKLSGFCFEVQKHPAYLPDFACSDYCLFPKLRNHLK